MCKPKTKWELCVDFHGHECMGLAIGYRQALYAMDVLKVNMAGDEEIFAVVENDACGVDAIQVLTGCTLGKGNLIYQDNGKQALTLASRLSNKAVRLIKKAYLTPEDERAQLLRPKINSGEASEEAKQEWTLIQKARIERFLTLPAEALFDIKSIEMPKIEKARIFKTIICSNCQEPFAESKARIADGKIYCTSCYNDYSRGW